LCALVLGLLFTACASRYSPGASSSHASNSTAATTAQATSKKISFDGVQLTIPTGWPVIDGAHVAYMCSSTFFDQADRAFLGPSYQPASSCPPPAPTVKPPPADGVWVQPGGAQPVGETATTLPGGQHVWTATQTSAVAVWFHGVSIELGIGPDPAVERRVLDSVAYRPTASDSPVLGRCPAQDPHPAMPVPRRLTAPLVLDDEDGSMQPESPSVRPRVSAASAWHGFFENFGAQDGALRWSIVCGSYSAQTPATINPDGSATPDYQGVPTWLIRGQGVPTAYGPCGMTVLAPVDADTGRGMGMTTISA
jgi:hypothetical protein